ncbi:uncharacterized protein LOC110189780 [Drosophila serrata]|uniref:uncharacterized protein LOC110189780 n=1 Tax=Drosophila serrata TaxID=7274 RepID=UPI000A1D0F4C|nr:uncharacterized protein LOC110189780 [Drosophila serrata]
MSYLNQIRPVLFLFYTVETLVNIILIHYYLSLLNFIHETQELVNKSTWYYSYLVCYYFFTVMTLFACVNVCTKNQPSILEEVLRPLVAFISYTLLTMLALYHAENDFTLMFPKTTNKDLFKPEEKLQSYFKLIRSQATASLACSVVYLLHFLIALDVLLSNDDTDSEIESSSDSTGMDQIEEDYQPVRLYVLGSYLQRWLETFQWFRDYVSDGLQDI